jgi:hypothetical protein
MAEQRCPLLGLINLFRIALKRTNNLLDCFGRCLVTRNGILKDTIVGLCFASSIVAELTALPVAVAVAISFMAALLAAS